MSAPGVDPDQIGCFVQTMFPHADEGTFASLRSFTHNAGDKPVEISGVEINGEGLAPLIEIAIGAANRAAQYHKPTVFAPPLATFSNRSQAREVDLANGVALSVEIDAAATEGLALLRGLLGPPTVVVASGGEWADPATGEVQPKLHGHWRLSEPTRTAEDHGKLKQGRHIASALVGGDATNIPAVHPIRWPGSVHRKGEPKLANIVEFNEGAEVNLGDALDRLEEAAKARGIFTEGTANGSGGDGEQSDTPGLIAQIMAGAAYIAPLTALSARYAGGGMTRPKIIDTLQGLMLAVPAEIRDGGQPGRWHSRFDGIPRMAASAVAKFGPKTEPETDDGPSLAHGKRVAEEFLRARAQAEQQKTEADTDRPRADAEDPSRDQESDHSAEAAAENANPHVGLPYDAALILQPGGILQTFADWMTSTAKRPQPMLALGASTALVGLLSAHKYRLVYNGNDTRTNVAIVCLAASSAGKDHPRRSVKRVMAEVGMQEFVGEDLASGQALEGTFIKYFAHLFMIDEYGHRIRAALDPKGNPNEKKIVEVVTKLSTSAAGPYVHSRMAMNRDSDVPLTWDPCLVMFNTTVEAPLWEGMHSGHVNDGSIARHLYFKTDADYPDNARDVPHFEERLPEMVDSALRILTGDPGNELALVSRRNGLKAVYGPADKFGRQERKPPLKPELITLPIDAEAKVELRRLEEEELALLREHQPRGTNALVGRLVEHATRLALICAVSDSPDGPVVGARHVRWGEAVAKRSIDTVLRAAATNIADTPHQANRNKLLRDIHRVAGGGWATARDVTRASQWCKTKDRNELLAELVDIGLVAFRSTKRGSQAVVEYRCQ